MKKITPAHDENKQALKDEYQNALDTLTTIRDASNMTNAQALQAVQYLAKVLILLLKFFARSL